MPPPGQLNQPPGKWSPRSITVYIFRTVKTLQKYHKQFIVAKVFTFHSYIQMAQLLQWLQSENETATSMNIIFIKLAKLIISKFFSTLEMSYENSSAVEKPRTDPAIGHT